MSNQQNSIMPLPQQFIADIRQIIASARTNAVRSVDFCRVQMYWNLGKRILEEEQQGKARAYPYFFVLVSRESFRTKCIDTSKT